MPTTIIFVSPLCTGPAKHVCSLMRLSTSTPSDSYAWRSIQTSPVETVPIFTTSIDARIGMPIACFGDAERFDHRPLALGRAAVVRAHRGEQKRPGTVVAKPIAGRPRDCGDIRDAAAAGRDADVALRHLQLQAIELRAHGRREHPRSDWRPAFDGRGGIS